MRYYRYIILVLALLSSLVCSAQHEEIDSLSFIQESPATVIREEPTFNAPTIPDVNIQGNKWKYQAGAFQSGSYASIKPLVLDMPTFHFIPGQAELANWNSGGIMATGTVTPYPGLMQIDTGNLGIYQSFGNFSIYGGATVNKYGYFRGLNTQYGVEGNLTYMFSPRLSASVFGTYYFGNNPRMANGMPLQPAILGFYSRSAFGGSIDYQINEYWGVEAGAQAVRQIGSNKYEWEPIATPYYKIGKKVKIGLPVGQILYHILRH